MATSSQGQSAPVIVPTHVLDSIRGVEAVFLPLTLLASWAMYFIGEKQCNDLLRRMSANRKPAVT